MMDSTTPPAIPTHEVVTFFNSLGGFLVFEGIFFALFVLLALWMMPRKPKESDK